MTDTATTPVTTPTELFGCPVTTSRGDQILFADREQYLTVIEALKDDGYNMCIDVTSVDYLNYPARELPDGVMPERFEVVVNLMSHARAQRLRVRVQVPQNDPVLPTLFDLYPGTEAMEREVYDLMGIVFQEHPDLTRILMPEDWEGHPLRKDYAHGKVAVQFKFPEGAYTEADTVRNPGADS